MLKIALSVVANQIAPVKGMDSAKIAQMLDIKHTITKRGESKEVSLQDCFSAIIELQDKISKLAPVTGVEQVAEMLEWSDCYKKLQATRVVAVDVVEASKEKALRENQQWVQVRNYIESYCAPIEEKAKANADFIKIMQEKAIAEMVAKRLHQLHQLNDFSKSEKDLRNMADDVFEAYLDSQIARVEAEKRAELARIEAEKQAEIERQKEMERLKEEAEKARLEAERVRAENAKRDALRNERNKAIGVYLPYFDYSGDVADMSDQDFSTTLRIAQLQLAKANEKAEAEKAEAQRKAELARIEAEKQQAEINRLKAEKEAAEKAEAERKAELARVEAERIAKQKALESASDAEKLQEWAKLIQNAIEAMPTVASDKAKNIIANNNTLLKAMINTINNF